jgi:very-short-patch-repair endonuclease
MTKIEKLFSLKNFEYIEYFIQDHHIPKIEKILEYYTLKEIKNYHACIYRFILFDIDDCWLERIIKIKSIKKDSSSLRIHILRFGEEIGTELFNIKCQQSITKKDEYIKKYNIDAWEELCRKKRTFSLESCIERFGEDDGKQKWNERLTKKLNTQSNNYKINPFKNGKTLPELQSKYGDELGYEKWTTIVNRLKYVNTKQYYIDKHGFTKGLELCRLNKDHASIEYFVKKYGEIEGKTRYDENCKKNGVTLDKMIAKYGEEQGTIKYQSWLNTSCIGNPNNNRKLYSKVSQKLFWEVYNRCSESLKSNIYFGELNQEYKLFYFDEKIKRHFRIDFKCEFCIIEYDCDYWHDAESDKKRDLITSEYGYKTLRINDKDYTKNKENAIQKCLDFLYENT